LRQIVLVMKSSLVLISLLFWSIFSVKGQTITGEVRDSINKKPVEYATVTIINNLGKKIGITTTNKLGKFSITNISNGAYNATVEFVGYKKKELYNISVNRNTNLGILLVVPFQNKLDEVVVKANNNRLTLKNDRQVFNATQFSNAKGGTAVDIVKNLPSIAVNADGEITLRGSNNLLVLVDGKPSLVDANTILSQLPAGNIKSVEVITSPSAKFDPEGKAGIINIITQKGTNEGLLVLANINGGLPSVHKYGNTRTAERFSGDIIVGFKKNKWDFSGALNYLRNDAAGYREGNVNTNNEVNNYKTSFPSVGERSFKRYNYGLRLSATYTIDESNTLLTGFYRGQKHQDREADLFYKVTRNNLNTGQLINSNTYYNANNQAREGSFTVGNIDYTHTFKDKSSLSTSLLCEGADLYGGTSNNNLPSINAKDTIQYTKTNYSNPLDGYRAKLDYQRKIGKNATLEAGYQFRYDGQNGNFDYDTLNKTTNILVRDANFSSAVKATNTIHSVYVQYSVQESKWFYSGGLRYETALRKLWFGEAAQPNLSLQSLFPSLQLRYSTANQWKWKAGLSRRVKRTTNTELNPFPEREHAETLERGDPKLLPEYVTLAEIGTEKTFKQGSWYATAYYQHTANSIQRLNSVYNDTILNRIYTNATQAEQVGVEMGLTLNPTKWWQMLAGINVFESHVSGSIFNGTVAVNNQKIAYTCNTTQSFKLPAKWSIQWSVSYLSLRPTAQGEDGAFLSPNVSLKKQTNNNKWTFLAQWLNMDAGLAISNIQRITTQGANFYTTTNYIVEPDVIQFGISYSFNTKNKKVKLPISEIGEKEF